MMSLTCDSSQSMLSLTSAWLMGLISLKMSFSRSSKSFASRAQKALIATTSKSKLQQASLL